ncbi:MAG: YigZ family protein [Bacteroidetes bacterium HGW-Bacteroidetes-17]|jgi:uncharacterized YigZ family protein|nr:MAG: YigZ family protein [Bacteroidetes bacterium HGW-Bacteroidetes-17]
MLFEDTYKTIASPSEGVFKDRGSKFIAKAFPVKTEDEVKNHLETLHKAYYDARHHCYAYQLGFDKSTYRINDDGEPSGTAGKPIFGQINSHDLTNILIVVIRYFGGTKLGVSGLINAYRTASKEAISNGEMITNIIRDIYRIEFQYTEMNEVMKVMKTFNLDQCNQIFETNCRLDFEVRKSESNQVYEKLNIIKSLNINFLKSV